MSKSLLIAAVALVALGLLLAFLAPTGNMGAQEAFYARLLLLIPSLICSLILFGFSAVVGAIQRLETQGEQLRLLLAARGADAGGDRSPVKITFPGNEDEAQPRPRGNVFGRAMDKVRNGRNPPKSPEMDMATADDAGDFLTASAVIADHKRPDPPPLTSAAPPAVARPAAPHGDDDLPLAQPEARKERDSRFPEASLPTPADDGDDDYQLKPVGIPPMNPVPRAGIPPLTPRPPIAPLAPLKSAPAALPTLPPTPEPTAMPAAIAPSVAPPMAPSRVDATLAAPTVDAGAPGIASQPAARAPTIAELLERDLANWEPPAEPVRPQLVREGQFAGRTYRTYDDGSLEIDTDQSTLRFDSLDEFRAFIGNPTS